MRNFVLYILLLSLFGCNNQTGNKSNKVENDTALVDIDDDDDIYLAGVKTISPFVYLDRKYIFETGSIIDHSTVPPTEQVYDDAYVIFTDKTVTVNVAGIKENYKIINSGYELYIENNYKVASYYLSKGDTYYEAVLTVYSSSTRQYFVLKEQIPINNGHITRTKYSFKLSHI